ncbi:MAG: phage tail assembly protein [Polyangia bacterium]
MAFKTEFPFTLPKGYIDGEGKLHRSGVMRLATAKDEIVPLQDYRVQNNRAYLVIVLLSRVISKLGELPMVDTEIIENLFSTDLAYLQEFYRRINEEGAPRVHAKCPSCQHEFDIDLLGGGDGRVVGQGG